MILAWHVWRIKANEKPNHNGKYNVHVRLKIVCSTGIDNVEKTITIWNWKKHTHTRTHLAIHSAISANACIWPSDTLTLHTNYNKNSEICDSDCCTSFAINVLCVCVHHQWQADCCFYVFVKRAPWWLVLAANQMSWNTIGYQCYFLWSLIPRHADPNVLHSFWVSVADWTRFYSFLHGANTSTKSLGGIESHTFQRTWNHPGLCVNEMLLRMLESNKYRTDPRMCSILLSVSIQIFLISCSSSNT